VNRISMRISVVRHFLFLFAALVSTATAFAADPVVFHARSTKSGNWSDPQIWEGSRAPKAGDIVQVRAGHVVVYDIASDAALRMVHVAGALTFSREKSTRLDVGLIKVEPGDSTTEDGFDCHDAVLPAHAGASSAALEIGTPDAPIPAGVTATIRLRHFAGTNPESLPAIIVCGGRWDVHGAPLNRTWLKLGATAKPGDSQVTLAEPVADWRAGDRLIITTGEGQGPESGHTFQKRPFARQKPVGTEEQIIDSVDGARLTLRGKLAKLHPGEGWMRCEVANLTRNVVIESADPAGVRGHTMYHHGSTGGISYGEFRHLGKDGVLGKYAIHFHLVRDTMRGSGVTGASIWDSHNRWITIHGADYLLIRDCVGYQSRGHGYFLEDASEQWNLFDRNLAVQAFSSVPLPRQVLDYDPNDGAGFWWANARNTFTRNVACENDRYGYHFHVTKTADFDPQMALRGLDGKLVKQDVRTIPLLRFQDNESHGEGLFAFRFGDEQHGSVRGDREHPFIARQLKAWKEHYAIRPNVGCFLLEGLQVANAAFGIYHPDYDAHVYRDISLTGITGEPINGGHDEESLPYGDFVFDGLELANCRLARDPQIQLTGIGPQAGLTGHFRGVQIKGSQSSGGGIVDFGGGPRTNKVDYPVRYYFHDTPAAKQVTRVVSVKTPATLKDADFRAVAGWTGPDAQGAIVKEVAFPELLAPVDDLPPATLITRVIAKGDKRIVQGVSHDNGEVQSVSVNGRPAKITAQHAGVAAWSIELDAMPSGRFVALATDQAGNIERTPHEIQGAAHRH